MKLLSEAIEDRQKKFKTKHNTYGDFNVGDRVKIICLFQDMMAFPTKTSLKATIVKNQLYKYLGIIVKFDKPYKGLETFGFNPDDLVKLPLYDQIKKVRKHLKNKYPDFGKEVVEPLLKVVDKQTHINQIPTHEVPEDFVIYAFRYCLGRQSYAVGWMTDWLTKNWKELSIKLKELIQREIKEANDRFIKHTDIYSMGMDCDREAWLALLKL